MVRRFPDLAPVVAGIDVPSRNGVFCPSRPAHHIPIDNEGDHEARRRGQIGGSDRSDLTRSRSSPERLPKGDSMSLRRAAAARGRAWKSGRIRSSSVTSANSSLSLLPLAHERTCAEGRFASVEGAGREEQACAPAPIARHRRFARSGPWQGVRWAVGSRSWSCIDSPIYVPARNATLSPRFKLAKTGAHGSIPERSIAVGIARYSVP